MSAAADPADGGLDFEARALRGFLTGFLGRPVADLSIRGAEGGMSNPTYFVDADGWRAVLRKQPLGKLAKSAHAIDREFRVLTALKGTDVPVPEPCTSTPSLPCSAPRSTLSDSSRVGRRLAQTYARQGLALAHGSGL